jgi:hypothetical protein
MSKRLRESTDAKEYVETQGRAKLMKVEPKVHNELFYCTNAFNGLCLDEKQTIAQGFRPEDLQSFDNLPACENRCSLPNQLYALIGEMAQNVDLYEHERLQQFKEGSVDYKANSEVDPSAKELRYLLEMPEPHEWMWRPALSKIRTVWSTGFGFWNVWSVVKILWEVSTHVLEEDTQNIIRQILSLIVHRYPLQDWLHVFIQFLNNPLINPSYFISSSHSGYGVNAMTGIWTITIDFLTRSVPQEWKKMLLNEATRAEFTSDIDTLLRFPFENDSVLQLAFERDIKEIVVYRNRTIWKTKRYGDSLFQDACFLLGALPFSVVELIMQKTLKDVSFPFHFFSFFHEVLHNNDEQRQTIWKWFNQIWDTQAAYLDAETQKEYLKQTLSEGKRTDADVVFRIRQVSMIIVKQHFQWIALENEMKALSWTEPAAAAPAIPAPLVPAAAAAAVAVVVPKLAGTTSLGLVSQPF